jgi:hypothetical protein
MLRVDARPRAERHPSQAPNPTGPIERCPTAAGAAGTFVVLATKRSSFPDGARRDTRAWHVASARELTGFHRWAGAWAGPPWPCPGSSAWPAVSHDKRQKGRLLVT